TGRQMDQNNNNVAGENPGDLYTGTFTLYGPFVSFHNVEPTSTAPVWTVDRVRVVFSSPLNTSTFTADDITNFTGPNGPITVTSVTADPNRPTTEFFVNFAPQGVAGNYSFTVGPDITDSFGNALDQNRNTITGE